MKHALQIHQGAFSPVLLDSALPQIDDTLDELGTWREADLRRYEDGPESVQHLLTGLRLVCKVAQTATLAALQGDTDEQQHRLMDELTSLRQAFAPREEIQATLRKLARCNSWSDIPTNGDSGADHEAILIDAGHLFDELTLRYRSALPTRGVYGAAVN